MIRPRTIVTTLATGAVSVMAWTAATNFLFNNHARAEAPTGTPVTPPTLKIDPEVLQHVDDFSTVLREVGKLMEPSVVEIRVQKMADASELQQFDFGPDADGAPQDSPFKGFRGSQPVPVFGEGSGVIMEVIGDTGYILTNNHVAGGATKTTIALADGRKINDAKLLGVDPKTDLAVLEVHAKNLVPARWGESEKLNRGDIVMAFGAPFGYVGSMSQGIVSGLDRQTYMLGKYGYEEFIQTDAVINPGNSGGPLVDTRGNVVGINAAIATKTGSFNGIGFAIPISQAKTVFEQLRDGGKVVRGFLGVQIGDVSEVAEISPRRVQSLGFDETRKGVYVSLITPGAPAEGELKPNDIITAIDGKPVETTQKLRYYIASLKPGTTVKLDVWRDKASQLVEVKLGEQPDDDTQVAAAKPETPNQQLTELGMGLMDATPDQLKSIDLPADAKGALVRRVADGSLAADAGLKAGDLITKVGDTAVSSAQQARQLLKKAKVKEGVTLIIRNKDGEASLFIQSN